MISVKCNLVLFIGLVRIEALSKFSILSAGARGISTWIHNIRSYISNVLEDGYWLSKDSYFAE